MRRADDVRETVDAILAEQRRAWVRGAVFAGGVERVIPPPRPLLRLGVLLLAAGVGVAIGLVGGDTQTAAALGVAAGLLLGQLTAA
jgi:hypothetical protein